MDNAFYSVIVVTKDPQFQKNIQKALLVIKRDENVYFAGSLTEARARLSKGVPTVIIYDTDAERVAEGIFAHLAVMFRLWFILTGTPKYSPLKPVYSAAARHITYIPKSQLSTSESSFLKMLREETAAFIGAGPLATARNAQTIADKDRKIIAIASSTGGTEALQKIFLKLTADSPPIVAVQHMPSGFTKLFADRLNNLCIVGIKEAVNNDYLRTGQVLIAPAGQHMTVAVSGGKLVAECFEGQRVHGVMPAADMLFDSVAEVMKQNAVGVILTGMGTDGARGLMKMHMTGAGTIGQDQKTCVVYGMPKAAFDMGALDYQLPLDKIADKMLELAKQ